MLFQWIIFSCVFIPSFSWTNTFSTLFINSSLSLPGYSYPITLKYELKLQTNPSKNQLIVCLKHQLSSLITDEFFIITLGRRGQGATESKNFTKNNSVYLNIGAGGPIPVTLTYNKTNLWKEFTLNYNNFLPLVKYSNDINVTVPECHNIVTIDSTIFCVKHTNTILNCSNENISSSSTVSQSIDTTTTFSTTSVSKNTVASTMASSQPTNSYYPSTLSSTSSTTSSTNSPIDSSTSEFPPPTLLPPNPTFINCTDPTNALNIIFCNISTEEIIPISGNISSITNATLQAINATTMSPEEIYVVSYILEQCSLIDNLTQTDFTGMAKLFDTIMLAPKESYENANDYYSNSANSLILSVNRMLTNSPSNVKYFDGLNIALLGKSLNCENNINNAGGSGITDLGNTFIENSSQDKSFVASIFINAETVCAAKATRVFYTIYRNSKFFVGDNGNGNGIISSASTHKNALSNLSSKFSAATTSKKVLDLPRICKRELLETDGRVVSATALKRTQKGDFKAIHSFETDNDLKNMVTIKYSEDHIGIPLHGKLKISWWDHSSNQWSPKTCDVKKESNYYTSECSHLTDFTLLVDGTNIDPLYCNTVLQTINYFIAIGSILGLFILCLIYLTMIIPYASNLRISRSLFKVIPISDISFISMVYTFILLLFYLNFTIFTDQRHTTGDNGCVAVAIISYWLLMSCVMLSLFNSWRIIKQHVKGTTMDKIFERITNAKVIYPITFLFSTLLALIFGFSTSGKFFYRNDSMCWIRPDYRLAIIIPFTILGLSAIICILIMAIRRFPILEKYFTTNRVKIINRSNFPNVKTRLFVLFLTQFNLGAPWLLQYFTIFSPNATVWHFLFVIFNGSQGIVIFIAFIYRCYMESKLRRVKESTIQKWKKSRSNDNNNQLQKPEINENESIKIDENCIQIISRAPSQVVIEKSEGNEIKRVNGKRKMIKALNDKTEEKDSSEFQLENGCLKVNENLQPDRLHVESNAASDIESIFEADSESLHSKKAENRQQNNLKSSSFGGCEEICTPSEGHLADTVQNTYNLDSNDDETSHHDNSTNVPHKKSSNLLDFNYIIDRVGSRVIRVYKDSDSSHFYCNAPK